MKKFVVIMISALVLFTFLMLNYLLWDKENLQKQRETDKVEQDWLRGQNRILTTTVEELEQANSKLEKEIKEYKDKIDDMESRIKLFQQRETDNLVLTGKLNEIINLYKTLMGDDIRDTVNKWFLSISQKDYEASYGFIGENFTFLGKKYDKAAYIELISAIDSIAIAEESKDAANDSFTIMEYGEPDTIIARVVVQAYIIDEKKASLPGIDDGVNVLEFSLNYNKISKKWVIISIIPKYTGNP